MFVCLFMHGFMHIFGKWINHKVCTYLRAKHDRKLDLTLVVMYNVLLMQRTWGYSRCWNHYSLIHLQAMFNSYCLNCQNFVSVIITPHILQRSGVSVCVRVCACTHTRTCTQDISPAWLHNLMF